MAKQKHTTGGIPRWSPTLVLVARFSAYVWQSGRDAQFSLTYGRMYLETDKQLYNAQTCLHSLVVPCLRTPLEPGVKITATGGIKLIRHHQALSGRDNSVA
jgi:hypothetical protein